MRTLNLGILAHVDAGKTTLTERLLYAAGVIDEIGSVDDGTTQTDTMALERQRGITIRSAVVSFAIADVTVNLIDTPGHPDFIAEVDRALAVLDGAVLVVSAVEGVQSQTRLLMRALQRLEIPTLVFVNKIDRAGARDEGVLCEIGERLTPSFIGMASVRDLGSRQASVEARGAHDEAFIDRLAALLADNDEDILNAYIGEGPGMSHDRLRSRLAEQTRRALVHPVLFGSAITGAGVDALRAGIAELLPSAEGDAHGPVSGTVFKVERGEAGEQIAYVRMFSGTVRIRDRLPSIADGERKVTAIAVFERGTAVQRGSVGAGQIGKLWGLGEVRIGDAIGVSRRIADRHQFAPPTLETVVVPRRPAQKGALHVALAQLAEQDPLIDLRQDDVRQELFVSLYGEVQKEVIRDTLANDFGVHAEFRETTTLCIERPVGRGEAVEVLGKAPNPFLATVGLRVEPAPAGTGTIFILDRAVLGKMPFAFFKAVEETVHRTLEQGIRGWPVRDCTVAMTHADYAPRASHAHQRFDKSMSSTGADFRDLTPLVLMDALVRADTVVCEPIHRFRLTLPSTASEAVWSALAELHAVPRTRSTDRALSTLEGEIPAAGMHRMQLELRGLTHGEGTVEFAFDRYQPVRGATPRRPRSDRNPLDRKEYLLHVSRRM